MPQGPLVSAAIVASEGELAVFCGWGGISLLDALERGAAGSMPAPNLTRQLSHVQDAFVAGDVAAAEAAFAVELPFLVWTMQSIDHSVAAAKEELRQRGVIASAHQRQPAARLDGVARGQLARFLTERLSRRDGSEQKGAWRSSPV
jgi:4-hydroxy-tetrahydrodipicolinate synthase